jgi:hypothetical protein
MLDRRRLMHVLESDGKYRWTEQGVSSAIKTGRANLSKLVLWRRSCNQ